MRQRSWVVPASLLGGRVGCWGHWRVGYRRILRPDRRSDVSIALYRAFELGITFFDTADSYGNGHSEELLGQVFGDKKEKVVIATKAGQPVFGTPLDFSPAHLRRSVEGSLRRLRREQIDLLQLHNPPIQLLRDQPEILQTLDDLMREGKVKAFGVSTKTPVEAADAIRELSIPVVQANFNLVDHRALETGLIDLAGETCTGLIARTPLAFGFLSGTLGAETQFHEGDHRAKWPTEQIARWASAGPVFAGGIAKRERQSLSQIALRFCLSYPAVTTAIPGMLRPGKSKRTRGHRKVGHSYQSTSHLFERPMAAVPLP